MAVADPVRLVDSASSEATTDLLMFSGSFDSDEVDEMSTTLTAVPDRIFVHQLHLTSADVVRRLRDEAMVREEACKAKEAKEIRRRQRQEEKKRDMEMLLSYHPWGKPGAGAQSDDPKRKKYAEPTEEEDEEDEEGKDSFLGRFGRPGHGAPVRSESGRVRTQIAGDPSIRFQDTQDVRLSIENQLRYKAEDKRLYRDKLDRLIEEKQEIQDREREWEKQKLEEMLEQYPFGRRGQPNDYGDGYPRHHHQHHIAHADPMFMPTKPKKIVIRDVDFDPWGKGFGNPSRDDLGNVRRHKSVPSVDEAIITDPPRQQTTTDDRPRRGGGGAPHRTDSGRRRTRLRNTLTNVKAAGPHVDDESYDPWGRPGGGAPFVREDGRVLEEKLGWSMTGHPKKRSRDAKNEYRNELQQEMREQFQKKQKEILEIHEPIIRIRPPQRMIHSRGAARSPDDVASLIRRGVGGRPRQDPQTGELLPNPRRLTDVTRERLDIRRTPSAECLAYHGDLSEQAAERREASRRSALRERAQTEQHLTTWDSFWGRPGHGAPRDPFNHKKENIERLLTEARPVEPYVKHYVTEAAPTSRHVNRYDCVILPAASRGVHQYKFRTPFPATEV